MMIFHLVAALVTWCRVSAYEPEMPAGHLAPCYQCEMYSEQHPHTHPYKAVRGHCTSPCNCGPIPSCGPGTPVVLDGCGCCWQCARQPGESCDGVTLCDSSKSLTCIYNNTVDTKGICKELFEAKCCVDGKIYRHGEMFLLDCRTQCTCQNGNYGCVSLCPGESLVPSVQCSNPHLVSIQGKCCREWMCDAVSNEVAEPPKCNRQSSGWSECSSESCGVGVSVRWSTENAECRLVKHTRLCQVRACQERGIVQKETFFPKMTKHLRKHRIRRGHTCKATLRQMQSVRLRSGRCISKKKYRPKTCADCPGRCCKIHASTTITVAFVCPLRVREDMLSTHTTETSSIPYAYDHSSSISKDGEDKVLSSHPSSADSFQKYFMSDDGSHDLFKDIPPSIIDNLTVDDDEEFYQIKNNKYETVHYQVEWILRCKCPIICESGPIQDRRNKHLAVI